MREDVTAATDRIEDATQDTRPAVLPRLGEAIPPIVQRFNGKGTLGVVLLDASPLAKIERSYGYDAYARAASSSEDWCGTPPTRCSTATS